MVLQRLGGENNSPKSEDAAMMCPPLLEANVEPQVSPRGGSQTPEVRMLKEPTHTKDKTDVKETKSNVSGFIRNIQNETKTDIKLEKAVKTGEWDMFADQDNFDNVDVSNNYVTKLKYLFCKEVLKS